MTAVTVLSRGTHRQPPGQEQKRGCENYTNTLKYSARKTVYHFFKPTQHTVRERIETKVVKVWITKKVVRARMRSKMKLAQEHIIRGRIRSSMRVAQEAVTVCVCTAGG